MSTTASKRPSTLDASANRLWISVTIPITSTEEIFASLALENNASASSRMRRWLPLAGDCCAFSEDVAVPR